MIFAVDGSQLPGMLKCRKTIGPGANVNEARTH